MLIWTLILKTTDSNKTKLNNLKIYIFLSRLEAMKKSKQIKDEQLLFK